MSAETRAGAILIGVISDTHGLLRPEAAAALSGVKLILHGGDIGKPEVVEALSSIAPVRAIRGNNDTGGWADEIPERLVVEVGGIKIYMLHDLNELDVSPASEGYRIVVSGHSHKPNIEERHGVLYINPGSAGPRRFSLPVTAAHLKIVGKSVSAEIIDLLK